MSDLGNLSLLAVCPHDPEGEALARELRRTRASVTHLWPCPETLPDDPDMLVCEYADTLSDRLPWAPGEATAALVVVLPRDGARYDPRRLHNLSCDAVLHRPFQSHHVATALMLGWGQFQYVRRLKSRIERLDENLKAMRDLERAKRIVMAVHKLDEEAAFAYLRKQAMHKRVSLAALAHVIVDSHEVLG